MKLVIEPMIEYGNIIYDSCTKADAIKIKSLRHQAANISTGAKKKSHEKLLRNQGAVLLPQVGIWQKLPTRF